MGRRRPVTAARQKGRRAQPAAGKADDRRGQDDQGKGNSEKEDADKGAGGQRDQDAVLQGPPADPHHGLQHHGQHRRLQAEEKGGDKRRITDQGIDDAQAHDRDEPGQDEQQARRQSALQPVHQPADVDRQLLGLGAGQQHAVVERVQKTPLADPAFLVDQDAVHDRDLPGGPAETQRRDPGPGADGCGKGDAVSGKAFAHAARRP